MQLGKLGVWAFCDEMTSPQWADFARRVEGAGYGSLWINEAFGRNALVASGWLLANTQELVVATGIANIYGRDPLAMVSAQVGLAEQSGGRFLLGIGVSHAPLVKDLRGHEYGKPVATMHAYLEAMAKVQTTIPSPPEKPRTVLAALGPKMLELSRDMADGAHPYNTTPEHTKIARGILGPGKLLCVEQKVLSETDPVKARAIGRAHLKGYLALPAYRNNWLRLGFDESDFAGDCSDRLIDATFAWGGDEAVAERVDAHLRAGADHVCIQLLGPSPVPDIAELERLAKVLT